MPWLDFILISTKAAFVKKAMRKTASKREREREICLPQGHWNLIPDFCCFFLKCFGLWRNRKRKNSRCMPLAGEQEKD